jgi:hypothetical protein
MPEAKIEIKAGGAVFHATGDQDWVSEQLDKFMENAAKLAAVTAVEDEDGSGGSATSTNGKKTSGIAAKPLATFLKERGATTNQTKKFLATAIWLETKGQKRLSTSDVSKALRDSNQTKLNNPSECLNQNVKKGFCEKDGKQFFVTEDGKTSS